MEFQYLLASILVILFLSYNFLRPKQHSKHLPPSPPSLPIIGHFHLLKQPLYISIDKLLQKFGPILFLKFGSRPVLILSSPTAVKECFTKNDIVFANRPQLVIGDLVNKYSTIPMTQYGDRWRSLRRFTTTEIFSMSRLDMTSCIREKEALSVVREMFRGYNGEFKKVELKSVFDKLIFNILARLLGMNAYFAEEEMVDPRKGIAKMNELKNAFTPKQIFGPGDFFPFLKWIGRWRKDKIKLEFIQKRDEFLQDIVEDFRTRRSSSFSTFNTNSSTEDNTEQKEKKRTIINALLSLQEIEPKQFNNDIIKGIILVMFTAGSVTTTTTMEWAMSLLLNHPKVLNKAREEIELNVGNDRLLNESDLIKLPYLHNIINETLRVHTPGHYLPPHESIEDCTIGGYDIPKGTMLMVNSVALHSNQKAWAEPNVFKPERFEKHNVDDGGINWVPFGVGRRGCPGEGLAMRMLGLTLGLLIQCFDWERVGGEIVDMSIGNQRVMAKATPFEAMYRPCKELLNFPSQL